MVCGKCGNQLEEGSVFCTACGNRLSSDTKQIKQSEWIRKFQENKVIDKMNDFIEKIGDRKINQYLSIAAIISMISVRLFGFLAITVLITITNLLLMIHNYKQNIKLDIKMLILSLAVFFVGVLIVI